jgi:hypothetical protein
MPPEEIRKWLRRIPFRPFRFYLVDGTDYDVLHPELLVLKLAAVDYFYPANNEDTILGENGITIAIRHITRLERIPL